VELDYL